MATHVKIATFNSTVKSWMSYYERLHFYFDANEIVDPGKKLWILLTVSGPSTCQLLKSLVQPHTPMEKTYDEIVEMLKTHFNLKMSPIIQKFFNTRDHRAGESLVWEVSSVIRWRIVVKSPVLSHLVLAVRERSSRYSVLSETISSISTW